MLNSQLTLLDFDPHSPRGVTSLIRGSDPTLQGEWGPISRRVVQHHLTTAFYSQLHCFLLSEALAYIMPIAYISRTRTFIYICRCVSCGGE